MHVLHLPHEPAPLPTALHAGFLALLPRIELHAAIAARRLRCPVRQADFVAEVVALAWDWYVRLARRGKDASAFAGTFAAFAARAVASGRRVCGSESSKDVLSPLAQYRGQFLVVSLPDCSTPASNPLKEALADNTVTPPDEQACFRIDFPHWLSTRSKRDRDIARSLMFGEGTLAVADRHGLSPGRVSQLRRDFGRDWQRFCGES
jgi:hypothetical protein